MLRPTDGRGARKDTVMVLPGATVTVELVADNPRQWLVHCHSIYHGEAGDVDSPILRDLTARTTPTSPPRIGLPVASYPLTEGLGQRR